MKRMSIPLVLGALLVVQPPNPSAGADPAPAMNVGWRTDGTGRYPDARPPTRWSEDHNVIWKTKLPGRGYGSPTVLGPRIFLEAEPAELVCVDRDSGAIRWQVSHTTAALLGPERGAQIDAELAALDKRKRLLKKEIMEWEVVWMEKQSPQAEVELKRLDTEIAAIEANEAKLKETFPPPIHRGGSGNAAPTPVSDGRYVFALFGTGIVSAHTLGGERIWMKYVEASSLNFGHAASPVLAGGRLIVHVHDLVALDVDDGREVWRVELPAAHATSLVIQLYGEDVLITPRGAVVRVRDGQLLAEGAFDLNESSPILDGRRLFAYQGARLKAFEIAERPADPMILQPLWVGSVASGRRTPSPVYHNGLLYGVNTAGLFDATDAATGDAVYRERMNVRSVYASVTLAGDWIFVCGVDGTTVVIRPGREYHELSRNQLEGGGSSPVFLGDRLYYRSREHLYCIGKSDSAASR